jgi:hypothetical protein
VGSAGGTRTPPFITGDANRYAVRKSEEVMIRRKDNTKADTARPDRSTDSDIVNRKSIAQATKKIAVKGDIYPIGIP